LTNAQTTNAGSYSLVATNGYGSVVSSNAVLMIIIPVFQLPSASSLGSEGVTVPVQLVAIGAENTLIFSLNFSNSILTYAGASLGSGASGAFLFTNTSQATNGRLGFQLVYPSGGTFAAGTQQVVNVKFNVPFEASATNTTIGFGDQPNVRQVLNANLDALPATYVAGMLTLPATAFEGDVYPPPNGNQSVDISDWLEAGRLVAGLDAITTSGEFQRLDCAPRSTLGDGQINVADWVQVGRYAELMDPIVPVGGPTAPVSGLPSPPATGQTVSLTPLTPTGTINSVLVQINSQGNENAFGGSVAFDPTLLEFLQASLGSGASGAFLEVNSNQAASGSIGFALALTPGNVFASGMDALVRLDFAAIGFGSNKTSITFSDSPVVRCLADANADVLGPTYQSAALTVIGQPLPMLNMVRQGSNVMVSWLASGTAFNLATTPALTTNWSVVTGTFITNNGTISASLPISNSQAFYRLQHP
jgi:hypothetical protein